MFYKVTCSYDGTNYAGFQSQKNATGIQDVIEKALKEVFKENIRIVIASRTDAGVHAYNQVFSFEGHKDLKPYNVKQGVNTFLPNDIHIKDVKVVNESFHPRYLVKEKTYEYLINIGEFDPLLINRAYQCSYKLDIDEMKKACELFIGEHNFASFNTSTYEEFPNQVRTITKFNLTKRKDILKIRVTGNGFLRNQVRIMVGSLVEVGRGKKTIKDIKEMINNPRKDTRRYNVEPGGLYLINIKY